MAEYYPLLARAVSGMRAAPVEQRRAIYDRARQALLGQLRSMQPAVPEESILRESAALDEAIARVEADLIDPPAPAGDTVVTAPPTPEPAVTAPPTAAPPAAEPESPPSDRAVVEAPSSLPPPAAEARPAEAAPPPVILPPVVSTPSAPPVAAAPPIAMPRRAAPSRPAADALSRIVAERGPVRAPQPVEAAGPLPRTGLPSASRLDEPSFADALAAAEQESGAVDTPEPERIDPPRSEPIRPLAPRPTSREPFNARALILAVVALAVVSGIAYAAWRLRDRPEQLARAQAQMKAAQQAEQQNANKISTRADAPGAPAATTGNPTTTTGAATTGAAGMGVVVGGETTQPTTAPTAPAPTGTNAPASTATPPPAADVATTQPPSTAAPAQTPTPAAPATSADPAIPVAQRAAFLVDAPDEPSKIKTYVGTVVWTTGNASPAQDQPIARTVIANVDIPDAGLKLTMTFQKNFEAQFPASHTLDLRFTLLPGSIIKAITQINVPQMRKDDAASGDPLVGLPVAITDNYFLVGLSRGDATQRNLELLKTRNWIDIPLMLASGKIAKITFEKGSAGQQALDSVIQSWQ